MGVGVVSRELRRLSLAVHDGDSDDEQKDDQERGEKEFEAVVRGAGWFDLVRVLDEDEDVVVFIA